LPVPASQLTGYLPLSIDEVVKKVERGVFILMLLLGVMMPLVGISIIFVYLLDRFVISNIKPLKRLLTNEQN
jgi:uncharacterized iron-regulated membrane protein